MKQELRTYARVSIKNILHNIREIKKLLSPGTKFMAVVKADAYGHGAVAVSKAIENKVDYLSVATLTEAIELKSAKIKTPILILSEVPLSCAAQIIKNDLIQTVYTMELAKALSKAAVKLKKAAKVHIKVDTGMGRIGVRADEFAELFKNISRLPNIKIEGIYTHLARAEEKNGFTREQLKIFRSAVSKVNSKGMIVHAANSAGAMYHRESHLDMVRIGLSLYGLYPSDRGDNIVKLEPALEFKTRVVYIKELPAGTPLSYGSTYITKSRTRIATLPVGYADGLPRALSNKGDVLIGGRRYPIAGRVCMDMTLVDVGNAPVKVGDEVTLIGRQGKEYISADEVARLAGTISYEIICGIGKRVPRVYQ
jgi:alanine racemase